MVLMKLPFLQIVTVESAIRSPLGKKVNSLALRLRYSDEKVAREPSRTPR